MMQMDPRPESTLCLIDELLSTLRESEDELCLTSDEWEKVRSALRLVAESLQNAQTSSLEPADRDLYRDRLLQLRQEIFRLERYLLEKRDSLARERHQLHAATAWNRSAHLS